MSITEQLNQLAAEAEKNRILNLAAIDRIEANGHKVELKGTEAVYIDDHLMIFFNSNRWENHAIVPTPEAEADGLCRGTFETGKIEHLLQ